MRQAVERADHKAAALTVFAVLEIFVFKPSEYGSLTGTATQILLALVLPLGVLAFAPLTVTPRWLWFLEREGEKHTIDDCMVAPEEIAKYTHSELIHRYDKYLGGGITSTQYHEDITGQIVVHARIAVRKQRLFRAMSAVALLAQLGLFLHLI